MHVHTLLFIKTSSIIFKRVQVQKRLGSMMTRQARSARTDSFQFVNRQHVQDPTQQNSFTNRTSLLVQRSKSSCAEGACKCCNVPFLSFKSVIVLTQFEFSPFFNLKHYNKLKSVSVLSSDSCKGQFWSSQYRNGRSRAAA